MSKRLSFDMARELVLHFLKKYEMQEALETTTGAPETTKYAFEKREMQFILI